MIKQVFKGMVLAALVLGPAALWAASASISAVAEMNPTDGNKVQGEIKLTQEKDGVLVKVYLEGVPSGKHPFHVHEKGDCSAADASSAGGHYNPVGADPKTQFSPDLGSLTANSKGIVKYTHKYKLIQLSGPYSIIGKAIVVHASGSPARIACGVIQEWHDNK